MNLEEFKKLRTVLVKNDAKKAFIENFRENRKEHILKDRVHPSSSTMLAFIRRIHIRSAVDSAFVWAATKEGYRFWERIENELYNE